jgi:lysozyme family protein
MHLAEQLQYELSRAVNSLRRRHASTGDEAERKVLTRVMQRLNKRLATLEKADTTDPLTAANALADATDDLEEAVAAANHGPFDGYLAALEGHLDVLSELSGALHGLDALPATPDDAEVVDAAEIAAQPKARGGKARALPTGLKPPAAVTDFASLKAEYAAWNAACQPRPERKGEIAYYLKRLNQGRALYEQVGRQLNIPWAFIGITHGMECGFNFKAHLHNGDPLTARTVQVPKGRPAAGAPPFTWSQSATDALIYKGYHQVADWSVPHMLHLFERYNGMGYRRRGVPTPYLWSYSNLYEKGKFVQDGRFDPNAVSKQCGAALMLKAVLG